MIRYANLAILACALATPAGAFDFAEFKSGTPREKVLELLKTWNLDKVLDISNDSILTFDLPEKDTFRRMLFNFCNEKLVAVEQDMRPSPKNFITLVNSYNTRYGQPLQVKTNVGMIATGEKTTIHMIWRKGADYFGVKYVVLPTGEALSITFLVYNSCWDPMKY
jgi:hypothetical protein